MRIDRHIKMELSLLVFLYCPCSTFISLAFLAFYLLPSSSPYSPCTRLLLYVFLLSFLYSPCYLLPVLLVFPLFSMYFLCFAYFPLLLVVFSLLFVLLIIPLFFFCFSLVFSTCLPFVSLSSPPLSYSHYSLLYSTCHLTMY